MYEDTKSSRPVEQDSVVTGTTPLRSDQTATASEKLDGTRNATSGRSVVHTLILEKDNGQMATV